MFLLFTYFVLNINININIYILAHKYVTLDNLDNSDDNGDTDNSSPIMLLAALCSAVFGLFMLIYIGIWAYKQYQRREYHYISNKNKPRMLPRISLRNLSRNREKTVMHPSSYSYTFDDE